jgi:hypothetical protein
MLSRFSVPAAPRPFIFDIDQALFIHFIFLNCCASIFLIISSLGAERMDNIPTTCIHHHHPSQYSPMPIPMPELERLRSMLSNVKVEAGFSKAYAARGRGGRRGPAARGFLYGDAGEHCTGHGCISSAANEHDLDEAACGTATAIT